MARLATILLCAWVLWFEVLNPTWTGAAALDNEAERALALFKAKAEQFQHFFAQKPMILSKQDFTQSPTGKSYSHVRLTLLDSGFDVQHTNSLVSPFIGYLSLTCVAENTNKCGDIVIYSKVGREKVQRDVYGYSTREKAIAGVRDCLKPTNTPLGPVRFTFAYQDGRWVFKDVLRVNHNKRDTFFLAALGLAEPPYHRVADNQAWETLIE
jgi:hypothetical protein